MTQNNDPVNREKLTSFSSITNSYFKYFQGLSISQTELLSSHGDDYITTLE